MDIDEIEKELKKAAKAIDTAKILAVNYKARLQNLCDSAMNKKGVVASNANIPDQFAG